MAKPTAKKQNKLTSRHRAVKCARCERCNRVRRRKGKGGHVQPCQFC